MKTSARYWGQDDGNGDADAGTDLKSSHSPFRQALTAFDRCPPPSSNPYTLTHLLSPLFLSRPASSTEVP